MDEGATPQHVVTHASGAEHWRHVVEIVALAIAAIWALYVFVYQERIKPAFEQPDIQFTLNVSHQPTGANEELVPIELAWKNLGDIDVQIDGFILNVYGVRNSTAPPVLHLDPDADVLQPGYVAPIVRTRDPAQTQTLLLSHFKPWKPLGGYLIGIMYPSTEIHVRDSIVVRRGEFDELVVQYGYCAQRKDDPFQIRFHPPVNRDGSAVYDSILTALRPSGHSWWCWVWRRSQYPVE